MESPDLDAVIAKTQELIEVTRELSDKCISKEKTIEHLQEEIGQRDQKIENQAYQILHLENSREEITKKRKKAIDQMEKEIDAASMHISFLKSDISISLQ